MPISLEAFGIDRLTAVERLELIELIWQSLPQAVAPEQVPAWHLVKVSDRRAAAAAQPGVGRPWREVLAELERGR